MRDEVTLLEVIGWAFVVIIGLICIFNIGFHGAKSAEADAPQLSEAKAWPGEARWTEGFVPPTEKYIPHEEGQATGER